MPSFAMTQSAANSLLKQYGSIIDHYTKEDAQFSITNIIAKLEAERKKAEQVALNAYHLLGYKGDNIEVIEKEMNEKIQNLQLCTSSLNGVDLYKTFVSALTRVSTFEFDDQKEFQNFINKCKTYIDKETGAVVTRSKEDFINVVYSLLGKYIADVQKESKRSKTGGWIAETVGVNSKGMLYDKKTGYNIGIFSEVLSTCGKNIRLGFQKFLEVENKKRNREGQSQINGHSTSTINGDSLTMDFNFETDRPADLAVSFLKMTKEKRKLFFAANPGLQEKIVEIYKQEVINKIGISGKEKVYFEMAMDRVVGLKGGSLDALFGATGANLTGVLGEIQSMYYVLSLTNGSADAEWIGGINNPHADILLRNIYQSYGIQVKNTMSPLGAKKEIEFQSFGMSGWSEKNKENQITGKNGIFKYKNTSEALKAMHDIGIPNNLSQAVETILTMYTFNVEYIREGWKAIPNKSNKVFHPTRLTIEEYSEKCQKVMAAFITSLMYMQTSNLSEGNSNTIYIIAGTTAISAASIIGNIIKEMEGDLKSFRMSMRTSQSMIDADSQYNITDVINGDKEMSKLHFVFQSSYTFVR